MSEVVHFNNLDQEGLSIREQFLQTKSDYNSCSVKTWLIILWFVIVIKRFESNSK